MQPTLLNVGLFWIVKYFLFYLVMMYKSGNYAFVKVGDISNREDLYYYLLLLFLFMPVLCIALFTLPMYFSLKLTSQVKAFAVLSAILFCEYLLYTWLASPLDLMNGVVNAGITLGLLMICFFSCVLKNN